MKSLNRIVLMIGYLAIAYFIGDVVYGNYRSIHPEVDASRSGVWAESVLAEYHTARSRDGVSLVVWSVHSSPEDLRTILSPEYVQRGRIWFAGPLDERGQAALEFLRGIDGFDAVRTQVDELLASGSYHYSWDHLSGVDDGFIQNVALWLVSPETRTLAYLNSDF